MVADLPTGRWCVWSTADLVLASKVRTVRVLASAAGRLKAKVLADFREAAAVVDSPTAAAGVVASSLADCDRLWNAIEPWPGGPVVHDPRRRTS